ncbi:MAG: Fe-S cluster assembly protein SufD [Bacteroidota bacterium]
MWYDANFTAFEKSLNGESNSPLHQVRRAAIAKFHELGFPTTRHEEWRFTNIAPITSSQFNPVFEYHPSNMTKNDLRRFISAGENILVFVNGHFARELSSVGSLPDGVVAGDLASALRTHGDLVRRHIGTLAPFEENAFVALNTAFLQDGAFIHIPDGKRMEQPIQIVFVGAGSDETFVAHPRNLFIVGKNSEARIVETYVSATDVPYLTNVVSEIHVGDDSVVEHDKLQRESLQAYHIASTHVAQGGRSNFTSNSIALGGSIARNNVVAILNAEGSDCTLNGLSLGTGSQLIDHHTTIDHAKPHCTSHELYKAVLDGKSRGVFNGKIFVRKDAQKTDAKQTNKTLLLSDDAVIDTKPQLEIFADDVKCTHGATVGQLDAEQIFYLRSRGIGQVAARDILTFAFASEVVGRVHVESLRLQLEDLIQTQLNKGRTS